MSIDEFSELLPSEFSAIWEAWLDKEEARERGEWERMRLLATITIQPHVSEKLTPAELLPFPWDKDEEEREPEIVDDARKERAAEALKRFG